MNAKQIFILDEKEIALAVILYLSNEKKIKFSNKVNAVIHGVVKDQDEKFRQEFEFIDDTGV